MTGNGVSGGKKKPAELAGSRLLTKSKLPSRVMFGLVPNIHNILKNMDPRHKAEDDSLRGLSLKRITGITG